MGQLILLSCILGLVCLQAGAVTVLFDFETDDEIGVWHNEHATILGSDKTLTRSESFAASGRYSMRFTTPAWRPAEHGGAQKWPAFEGTPPITDWSKYDRLVMEMVNLTDATQKMMLFISDSKKATRNGLIHREIMPPHMYTRAIVDLRKGFGDRGLDAADVHVMHFFTEDPPEDLVVHLDRFLLLEPGEAIPPVPGAFLRDIAALHTGAINEMTAAFERSAQSLRGIPGMPTHIRAWVESEISRMQDRLAQVRAGLQAEDESVLDLLKRVRSVQAELDRIAAVLDLRMEFDRVRARVEASPGSADGIAAGFATSMEKVLPRAGVPSLDVRPARVSAARNERESFQVVVYPFERDLKQVQVRVVGMKSGDGTPLPGSCITAPPVGYVETKRVPPYGSSHVGWWPDPILTFTDRADIAMGDAQSFWVNIDVPKDQPAGLYRGKLEVVSDGKALLAYDLSVRVYGFAMPDASPLPMAITFWPHDHLQGGQNNAEQETWRSEPDYPIRAWRKHKSEWADFLAEYYITMDSLYAYGDWEPQFDELKRLKDAGKLGTFNLGYYSKYPASEDGVQAWRAATIDTLRPRYEKAKDLGILDKAYIYGCDEHPKEEFPWVEKAAAAIKAEFPDVMVMTTTYDHSYGMETEIKSMDAWCPLTPRYNKEAADEVRGQGKQVWWYICCGPHHPFPNMFIEYPAIDGRILMGAMTAKFRPDGFLYYQISIWNSRKPIDTGPFTDWDPRSWTTYHGDGSWTCIGPDGTPLPTVRLENFRDGLEDYAYFRVLEATVAKVKASAELRAARADWLAQAEEALAVPDGLVASGMKYSMEPGDVYRWRNGLAELIEAAGVDPACPW